MDFRILGPLEILEDGRAVSLGGSKVRPLLALFLIHANERLGVDQLIEALWGEHPPPTATKTVQVHVSRLRKALAAGQGEETNAVVLTRGDGYELVLDPALLDAHRFERLVTEGRSELAAGRARVAISNLEEALGMWRGRPLDDLAYESFAQNEIARLEDLHVVALEHAVDAKLALGRHSEVVAQLEGPVADHPYREGLRAQLMLALYRCDRQADALQAYQDARRVLVDELGIEPGDRLRGLERAILAQDAALAPPQATDGGDETLSTAPNNLPKQPTSFVGRDSEVSELLEALARTRLLTLIGTGGSGKTRLALKVATDVLGRFTHGAWWIELAPHTDPSFVGQAITSALGVRPLPGEPHLEAARRHLAGRRALVILDNCEHLLAASAAAAAALLAGCENVSVVATSRSPLGLATEVAWRVPSLSLPPEGEALGDSDAVRLFIDRATAARPSFPITNETTPVVARICRELDGIPLAIEFAAARRRMLSLERIAAGLADRFHLLTGGAPSALPRQQTLRASVEWSYDLLGPKERILFRRLPVFLGGFSLEAAEGVGASEDLPRPEILDLLAALIDNSLVVVEERGSVVRYRMLETVREYALEQLVESGGSASVRARHRDFFLVLAETAAAEPGRGGEADWLEMLDPEAANLAAALDCAAETDGDRALRFCIALHHWWRLRGLFAAAESSLTRALEAADPAPSASRARVLASQAHLLINAGEYIRAIEAAQQSREMAEEVGDDAALAGALDILGTIQLFPDPLGSRPLLEESRKLAERAGVAWCQIDATQILTWSFLLCDEYEQAERLLGEVLPLIERTGYREYVISWYWYGRSYAALMRAEADAFLDLASKAAATAEHVGDPVSWGGAQACMAILDLAQGRAEEAVARLEASRERVIATGAGIALPWTDTYLAHARATTGDFDRARAGLENVIQTGADFGYILAWALIHLADVLRVTGDLPGAEARVLEARETSERVRSPILIARSKEIAARLAAERGAWPEAEGLAREALAPRVERLIWLYVPQALDTLAEAVAGRARHEEAARVLGVGERGRKDLGLARWSPDAPRFAALERSLGDALGEERFEAIRAEGAALSLDHAVEAVGAGYL